MSFDLCETILAFVWIVVHTHPHPFIKYLNVFKTHVCYEYYMLTIFSPSVCVCSHRMQLKNYHSKSYQRHTYCIEKFQPEQAAEPFAQNTYIRKNRRLWWKMFNEAMTKTSGALLNSADFKYAVEFEWWFLFPWIRALSIEFFKILDKFPFGMYIVLRRVKAWKYVAK